MTNAWKNCQAPIQEKHGLIWEILYTVYCILYIHMLKYGTDPNMNRQTDKRTMIMWAIREALLLKLTNGEVGRKYKE